MSAATSGLVSGAATGAATGMYFGHVGAAAGGVLGGIAGLISGRSADAQFSNQMAWANYNRQSQYNTDIFNIQTSLMVAGANAMLARMSAKQNAKNIMAGALYNTNIIGMTTEYNTALLENELTQTWNDLGLDISQVESARAREQGLMEVSQGASGTVMGTGSNAAVLVDQQTQEYIDINVLQFGADRQAADIANQMAQGIWEGQVAMQQTMWEGQMAAFTTEYNANVQAAGILLGAGLNATAGKYNAEQQFATGGYNMTQAGSQFDATQKQQLIAGLFNAGGTAGQAYYRRKPFTPSGTSTTGAGSSLPYQGPLSPNYNYGTTPGTSLAVAKHGT